MKKRVWALLTLALVAIVGTTAGTGTTKGYAYVTSTGAIIGNGTGLLKKRSVLQIAEIKSGGAVSLFKIWSSNGLESSPDTLALGNGVGLNEYFNGGQVDSLYCLVLGSGSEFLVTTDNKP